MVGVNEYVTDEEIKVPVFRHDPQIEEVMVQRLKEFKSRRNNGRVKEALHNLREVAEKEGEQMSALINAAREGATLGELMSVLRETFGWGVS